MDLKLYFFKRVLLYWIDSHNVDFPLLEDGLSADLATYINDALVFKHCFKRRANPLIEVSENSMRSYLTYDMKQRMNDFIPCVLADMQKEYSAMENEMIQLMDESAVLEMRAEKYGCNLTDEAKYRQIGRQIYSLQSKMRDFQVIGSWFTNGCPRFIHSSIDGTNFVVYLTY